MPPASVPESWTALATIVVSTVSRSSVEFTAWDTSPSARSSSTERASSRVSRLHLVKEPHVLDRDQRLVGESGDELDLPVRERLDVIALETDDGDHYVVAQQRNPEHGALPADLLGLQHVVLGISQPTRQVNRFSLNRGSADQRATSRCYRMLKKVFDIVGPDVVGPHQVVFAALQLEEKGMFRL